MHKVLNSILLLISVSLICVIKLHAQSNDYDLKHYTMADGLLHQRVTRIIEHSNGFIYIGTLNGLCSDVLKSYELC